MFSEGRLSPSRERRPRRKKKFFHLENVENKSDSWGKKKIDAIDDSP